MGNRILGWHNFANELMLFHTSLKQFLIEPNKNIERMKKEALSMKNFIETVIETPEVEDGSIDSGS